MLAEAIEDQLSLNSTLPRTLAALLFRPGFLSNEYINGRIQRYIPPFRLYLASSVVFFLLLSFQTSGRTLTVQVDGRPLADSSATVGELLQRMDTSAEGTPRPRALKVSTGWGRLDTLANRRIMELEQLPPQQAVRTMVKQLLQRAPTAAFLMLPIFALLLLVLFFRRRRYYVEHFVFALHTHAFLFVLFTIMLLGSGLPALSGLLLLWQLAYGYLALRRYYGQGRLLTLVKYGVLGLVYAVVLSAAAAMTVVATLILA